MSICDDQIKKKKTLPSSVSDSFASEEQKNSGKPSAGWCFQNIQHVGVSGTPMRENWEHVEFNSHRFSPKVKIQLKLAFSKNSKTNFYQY